MEVRPIISYPDLGIIIAATIVQYILGAVVFQLRRSGRAVASSTVFFRWTATLVAFELFSIVSILVQDQLPPAVVTTLAPLAALAYGLMSILTVCFMLHLSYLFPHRSERLESRRMKWFIYHPVLVVGLMVLTFRILGGFLILYLVVVAIAFYFITLRNLIRSYRAVKASAVPFIERQVGLLLGAVLLLGIGAVVAVANLPPLMPIGWLSLFMIAQGVVMAYSMFRYQLFDAHEVVTRTLQTTLATGAGIGLFTLVSLASGAAHEHAIIPQLIAVTLILVFYRQLERGVHWLVEHALTRGAAGNFRVEELFLIHLNDGLVLYHHAEDDETRDDGDAEVIGGMLTALQAFVNDALSMGEREYLNVLRYGKRRMIIEHGEQVYMVVVIAGKEDETLVARIQRALASIQRRYGPVLADWSGDISALPDFGPALAPVLAGPKPALPTHLGALRRAHRPR